LAPGLRRGLTPTTRVAAPDPGQRSIVDSSGTRVDTSISEWPAEWFRQGPSITRLRIWCCNQSRAQRILAVIVGLITGVLLMESYGAMVTAARAGGRAIPELWPLGTEALALAMEVSVLEAKRLGHRAVLRLSWLLLVASVARESLTSAVTQR
jgi:hypothetical protein